MFRRSHYELAWRKDDKREVDGLGTRIVAAFDLLDIPLALRIIGLVIVICFVDNLLLAPPP